MRSQARIGTQLTVYSTSCRPAPAHLPIFQQLALPCDLARLYNHTPSLTHNNVSSCRIPLHGWSKPDEPHAAATGSTQTTGGHAAYHAAISITKTPSHASQIQGRWLAIQHSNTTMHQRQLSSAAAESSLEWGVAVPSLSYQGTPPPPGIDVGCSFCHHQQLERAAQ